MLDTVKKYLSNETNAKEVGSRFDMSFTDVGKMELEINIDFDGEWK